MRHPAAFLPLLTLFALLPGLAPGQFFNDYDLAPHHYFKKLPQDPMSILLRRVEAGELALDEPNGKPLVERLLRELKLDKHTQTLVFSKTSLQRDAVSYRNPRAIYFNDSVYLGWMPDGRIEIASYDPELGPLFYFQRPLADRNAPLFARNNSCLGCHAGDATNFIPGALGRSVFPDASGRPQRDVDDYRRSGHQIPFDLRWGGWFVSGRHGDLRHLGNALAHQQDGEIAIDRERFANLASLDQFFNPDAFPAPGSDVTALLVFDHQVTMHYCLVEAAYRARQSLFDSKLDPAETDPARLAEGRSIDEFNEGVGMVVDYLLFREEVDLGQGVTCDPEFRRAFTADKRCDPEGRSLKDLRLDGRIFEHRCSYMIYSPTFNALPPMMKQAIYARLHEILTAAEPVDGFEYLDSGERQRIVQILRATKPDLPAAWK